MNYYTKDKLFSLLKENTKIISFEKDRASIVISEYGGRILGLFPDEENYTLLWINQDLEKTINERRRDIGGDRFWLSPERTFFYKDPENWEGWECPKTLDPANYHILKQNEFRCILESEISVQNQFNQETYEGKIAREFSLIEEPIKTVVSHIGVEINENCVLNSPNLSINGWDLTNIISGGPNNPGTVLIPTSTIPKPLSYFRVIPEDKLIVKENYLGFKIDVDDIYKLGVRPEDIDFASTAKIGYVLKLPDSEKYGFLVKLSEDVPKSQECCFDIARDHPNSEIGVIQSYNAESPNKPLLRYGEIELQLNMFESTENSSTLEVSHQMIAYIGTFEEISTVVEKYLGIEDLVLFE
ncbi:MAG: hypothetical protein BAJALOKI2v1_90075 [Promethearchaeota archaeon]|nr:MAG: hypothetical protein BAJALOKI2v1_90075 [Candidatus Lokiarchaeota archaeon]